jgi:general secretion pathway protein G
MRAAAEAVDARQGGFAMNALNQRSSRGGFTLIEILIVVIILGILAGIVIPQFGYATTASKTGSVQTTAQTLRGAVQLYYCQHNDRLPSPANFWTLMMSQTDANGAGYTSGTSTTGPYGPYLQSMPSNALNLSTTVIDSQAQPATQTASICGWAYDYNGGSGSGTLHGTDQDQRTVVP